MDSKTITINNKTYELDSLSEEAKNLLNHIGIVDNELVRCVNVHSSLTAGRQVAVTDLIKLVEATEDETND